MGKKLIIFIESNTTGTGMIALTYSRSLGYTPLLLTNDPSRYKTLDSTQAEVMICNTNSSEDIIDVINGLPADHQILGVMTTSEFYLVITAEIAKKLGLPGNSVEAAKICRNKALTRQHLSLSSLSSAQPRFELVKQADSVASAIKRLGLPCIVKPTDDSGSTAVKLCLTEHEVLEQVNLIQENEKNIRGQAKDRTVLLEEFIKGREYSVEMVSGAAGHQLVGITEKKVMGEPFFVEYQHIFPAELPQHDRILIQETVSKALTQIGIQYGPTHTEVKLTEKGCMIIEINARLAGGMIPALIKHSTGVDLLEWLIYSAIGTYHNLDIEYQLYSGIYFIRSKQNGILEEIKGVDEANKVNGVVSVYMQVQQGDRLFIPQNAYHRLGYIMAKGKTKSEVEKILREASSLIQLVYRE